ncbi:MULTISPECIES: DUF3515 family protein [Agromyces]|uniref:DUF3515 family protein n=1 Tax=Agromyces indicus TaxID=758919 RepID=A0ABU1FJQ2_9MICO|nr:MULTISPECIES: DUF3515 family protein [Agromyces]MCK8610203.1 DUF3515 domain-containing protein [Agromyces sp. C10]MDR5691988.1 DUF3515 family protein [Agromyces indicus]
MPAPRPRRPRRTLPRLVAAASVAVVALPLLASCARPVPFEAAPDAVDPDCAAVIVRLPDVVAGQEARETDAQGTGAWGTPASVLLRCGVEPPGPTTLRCVSVDEVDWIIDESDAPRYRFTTYGRTPAVEVVVDNDVVAGTTAIADVSSAVSVIEADGGCTDLEDLAPEG